MLIVWKARSSVWSPHVVQATRHVPIFLCSGYEGRLVWKAHPLPKHRLIEAEYESVNESVNVRESLRRFQGHEVSFP
jgi:hypothetical protein